MDKLFPSSFGNTELLLGKLERLYKGEVQMSEQKKEKTVRIEEIEIQMHRLGMEVEIIRDQNMVYAKGAKSWRLHGEGTTGFSIVLKLQKPVGDLDRIEVTAPKTNTEWLDIHPIDGLGNRVVSRNEVFKGKNFVSIPVGDLEQILYNFMA